MTEKANDQSVVHHERDGSDTDVKDTQAWSDARAANEDEHNLGIREALKQYRWAVMWSLVVSMSIIMEGYDTNLIGNVSALSDAYTAFSPRLADCDADPLLPALRIPGFRARLRR